MNYIKITIVAKGNFETDLEDAVEEAMRRIKNGCCSGAEHTNYKSFYFETTENVPEKDRPA